MFEYEEVDSTTVMVQMNRPISIGHRFRISASQGFAGIIDGVVEVTHILTSTAIQELAGDDDVSDLIAMVESYKETALDMHTNRDEVPYEPEYSEELARLDNTVWIMYRYPRGEGINEGLLVFPIEEFVDHTSLY